MVAVRVGAGRLEPGPAPAAALVCGVLLISEAAGREETKEMKLIHGNVSLFSHLELRGLPAAPGCGWAQGLGSSSGTAQFREKR